MINYSYDVVVWTTLSRFIYVHQIYASELFLLVHVPGEVHSTLDLSVDEWNSLMRTNLTGLWLVTKHVCRRMRDAKLRGSVINISSIVGLNRGQLPGGIAYTGSKTGVNAVSKVIFLRTVIITCSLLTSG